MVTKRQMLHLKTHLVIWVLLKSQKQQRIVPFLQSAIHPKCSSLSKRITMMIMMTFLQVHQEHLNGLRVTILTMNTTSHVYTAMVVKRHQISIYPPDHPARSPAALLIHQSTKNTGVCIEPPTVQDPPVSFSLQQFARIPWPAWRDMAAIYGRKYVTKAEAQK